MNSAAGPVALGAGAVVYRTSSSREMPCSRDTRRIRSNSRRTTSIIANWGQRSAWGDVPHPEFAMLVPSGRTAYVVTPDVDVPEIIDVALIVSLSPIGGSTSGTRAA